ncbi:MAG: Response regulator receiver protein [Parcubacteria group bacterium GW2011_GWA2_43_11]|nr:MAG: Response regulator receiver protein [Parcubacteria group bacterium GW2011_GWC2_42_11]KKS85013.1 MAG: Response regulator receiver protein [Parcubacteria group bacterium GW2011_GWA2_43_11]
MGLFGFFKKRKEWKVLVVEDDVPLRQFMAERLLSLGVDVIETGDGFAVIDLIQEHNPDCVILDIMLPGKSGMQILEELRASDKKTPVVILTTLSGEGGLKLEATKHNAIFLNKANTALEVVIDTVLRRLYEKDDRS